MPADFNLLVYTYIGTRQKKQLHPFRVILLIGMVAIVSIYRLN